MIQQKSAAHEIPNFKVSPLAAVVTDKARIIVHFSFEVKSREKKGELTRDTDPDTVPQCPCAEAPPKFRRELVTLRNKFPAERISMRKPEFADAFRNVSADPDKPIFFATLCGTPSSDSFSFDVLVVGIVGGVLGRHVGGRRTRALQHHTRFSSVFGRKKNKSWLTSAWWRVGQLGNRRRCRRTQNIRLHSREKNSTHASRPCM